MKYPYNPYKRKKLTYWGYIYVYIHTLKKFLKFYIAEIISKGKINEIPSNWKRKGYTEKLQVDENESIKWGLL